MLSETMQKKLTKHFQLMDIDQDGFIERAFFRLDFSEDGLLSRVMFIQHGLSFYISDDLNERGNWLFGPYE